MHSKNQINPTEKTDRKFWCDLLKSIFIIVKMIRSSSDHSVFSWVYMNYKSLFYVEIDDILIATQNSILFEMSMQEFDTIFDYTS